MGPAGDRGQLVQLSAAPSERRDTHSPQGGGIASKYEPSRGATSRLSDRLELETQPVADRQPAN